MFIMMKKAFTTKFQMKKNHLILLKYHKKSTQFVPSFGNEEEKKTENIPPVFLH